MPENKIKLQDVIKPFDVMPKQGCFGYTWGVASDDYREAYKEAVKRCEIEANRQHNLKMEALREENKRLREALISLIAPVENICDIANNSEGITGWHMNGDILRWEQVECITEFDGKLIELKNLQKQIEEADR